MTMVILPVHPVTSTRLVTISDLYRPRQSSTKSITLIPPQRSSKTQLFSQTAPLHDNPTAVPATAAANDNDATQLCSSSSLQADSPATISTFQWDDFNKFSRANFQPLPQPFTWDDFYKEFPNITDDDAA